MKILTALGLAATVMVGAASAQRAEIEPRNVELIIDASGSMRARLPGGQVKLDAAKQAIASLVDKLPNDINLSLRAYGHQSDRSENNCKDTAVLVPFGNAGAIKGDVVSASGELKARGYTPISYSLGQAAKDLKGLLGSKSIILVSDGKETCAGDPCVLAKQLAEANTDLVIHTVGFGVDAQTRAQLQCIAKVGRGKYFSASSADSLVNSMQTAAVAKKPEPKPELKSETIVIKVKKQKFGHLHVKNGEFMYTSRVLDAETGKDFGSLSGSHNFTKKLKPGIYKVNFGTKLFWNNIRITADKTTVLEPGLLRIENHRDHLVRDSSKYNRKKSYWDHTATYNKSNSGKPLALPPGTYDVNFGQAAEAAEHGVKIISGKTTTLIPAVLKISELLDLENVHNAKTGKLVGSYHTGEGRWLALLPGDYFITFENTRYNFTLKRGKTTTIHPGGLKITPTPKGKFYNIYYAEDDKNAASLHNTDKKGVNLAPGKYYVKIGEQKVPFTVTMGKMIEIKLE